MDSNITTLVKILEHQKMVAAFLKRIARELEQRADIHDISKLSLDEFGDFCKLDSAKNEYGSPEYEAAIRSSNAPKLHTSRNRHHPEYWPDGILGMTTIDIIEMLCDWEIARLQRDTTTDMEKTWQARQERFKLTDDDIVFLRRLWEGFEW